jgi:hypothetical protein
VGSKEGFEKTGRFRLAKFIPLSLLVKYLFLNADTEYLITPMIIHISKYQSKGLSHQSLLMKLERFNFTNSY